MREALDSFTPALLIGARYTISGCIMVIASFLTGARLPRGREFLLTARNGVLILGIGSGAIALTETWIPTGLAAIFITTCPFWLVGMDASFNGAGRLRAPAVAGMFIGLAGTALLVSQSAVRVRSGNSILLAFLILQLGCASWALGSILHVRLPSTAHSVVSGGVEQLGAGIAFLIVAWLTGGLHVKWTIHGAGALLYLVVFGSLVGYSAYTYALDRLPVSLVSIYTYINPIVAVFLGWLIYREPFGFREAVGMLVIFAGVAIVKGQNRKTVSLFPEKKVVAG
jgi:drug/metabolite transporter (DMT)-like permease